jgi:hypothetical protein
MYEDLGAAAPVMYEDLPTAAAVVMAAARPNRSGNYTPWKKSVLQKCALDS